VTAPLECINAMLRIISNLRGLALTTERFHPGAVAQCIPSVLEAKNFYQLLPNTAADIAVCSRADELSKAGGHINGRIPNGPRLLTLFIHTHR